MIEVKDSALTATIPQSRYEWLLDIETRVDVAVERMTNDKYCNIEDVLRILGTELALRRADEIREEEKKHHEEYLKQCEEFEEREIKMKDFETMSKIAKEGSFDTFIQKVKELPLYGAYEMAVKKKEDSNTAQFLQMSVMLMSMGNDELSMLMTSVSLELLFAMADQKLRNEILESEEENESKN